jgi:hypothetical protein
MASAHLVNAASMLQQALQNAHLAPAAVVSQPLTGSLSTRLSAPVSAISWLNAQSALVATLPFQGCVVRQVLLCDWTLDAWQLSCSTSHAQTRMAEGNCPYWWEAQPMPSSLSAYMCCIQVLTAKNFVGYCFLSCSVQAWP